MRQLTTYRNMQVFLVIMAIIGMSFALFYLQRHLGLSPCPLCIFQRVGLIVMGGFALISALFNPKSKVIRLLLWLGSLVGIGWAMAVAARHVWLQYLPADQVPSCGPGLNYWLDTLPILQVFEEVFAGSGECASVDWTFMGLTSLSRSLILLIILLIVHILILLRIVKSCTN